MSKKKKTQLSRPNPRKSKEKKGNVTTAKKKKMQHGNITA